MFSSLNLWYVAFKTEDIFSKMLGKSIPNNLTKEFLRGQLWNYRIRPCLGNSVNLIQIQTTFQNSCLTENGSFKTNNTKNWSSLEMFVQELIQLRG